LIKGLGMLSRQKHEVRSRSLCTSMSKRKIRRKDIHGNDYIAFINYMEHLGAGWNVSFVIVVPRETSAASFAVVAFSWTFVALDGLVSRWMIFSAMALEVLLA